MCEIPLSPIRELKKKLLNSAWLVVSVGEYAPDLDPWPEEVDIPVPCLCDNC